MNDARARKVGASQSQVRLMDAIGRVIMSHTTLTPMTEEDIVSVLAFCTGCAVGQSRGQRARRQMRETAVANLDNGIRSIEHDASGLVIQGHATAIQ